MDQIFKLSIPFLLVLVLPGFIYGNMRRFTIGQESASVDAAEAIRILIRSVMVTAFTVLVLVPSGHQDLMYVMAAVPVVSGKTAALFGNIHQARNVLLTFIILPGVYGCMIGLFQRAGWSVKAVLKKYFKNRAQPSDQAIDQAISDACQKSKEETKNLVIGVQLDQGMVYGLYGLNSKISESGGYRDIYLEATWQMDDKGDLAPSPDGSSIFVKGSTIQALVFFFV